MFRKIKLARTAWKALGQYDNLRKDVDTMDTKSMLKSKTFWMNVLGLAITIGGLLPQKWAVPVLAIANIGMRMVTNQPVGIFSSKKDDGEGA